jgi:uncharacterized membrane protein
MKRLLVIASAAALAAGALPALAADPAKPTAAQLEHFETKVRPVLAEHCYSCHGAKKQSAGLRLDTAAGIKAGADDGAQVVFEQSARYAVRAHDDELPRVCGTRP